MVLVDNKKYACETCIKGHRSSSCQHTDRPLFEIKRKGRPVTQCEHCRELRKTKQVHVKCICEKDDILSDTPSPPSTSPPVSAPLPRKKGKTKVPDSAAFPHGLPEQALEATVAPHSSSESVSSDSDHGGRHQFTCFSIVSSV
ncbi:copper-binding transcription factor [Pleurotus ostreatus]|nr:copper-binding transcription factor [Pleurotus ostreatus]